MTSGRLGPLYLLLVAGVAACVVLMLVVGLRAGGYALAGLLLAVGLARVLLSDDETDGARVRSRGMDLLIYTSLAAAVLVVFASVGL